MPEPSHTAIGAWSGGRFIRFGEPLDQERLVALFRQAYEDGVRTFITTDVLGSGEGDRILAEALAHAPRETYCLVGGIGHDFYEGVRQGTKGFPRFTNAEIRGEEEYAPYIRMATEKSLERIRADQFDLLLLHNPDRAGYSSTAVWDGLEAVREEGLTRLIGVAPGPANGFTVDLIDCFEQFGERIDWAMIILNPFEPWPGELPLPAAREHNVKLITRVVDHGGIFHDDVRPGHVFTTGDHRTFRPDGWIEAACEKLESIRPIGERASLTPLQLACQWNLAHDMVECAVPTLMQESGNGVRPIEDKLAELTSVPQEIRLTEGELATTRRVGENKGLEYLKGASRQYQGEVRADQWPMTPHLEQVAKHWGIEPDRDLYSPNDPRDLREKGMSLDGSSQTSDRRLYIQLQVFTDTLDAEPLLEATKESELEAVLYANVNDPRGVGILTMSEEPDTFTGEARDLFTNTPFKELTHVTELTMFGRTYGLGREPDLEDWLLQHPRRATCNQDLPWAVWYPLRRSPAFYMLAKREQGKILADHAKVGRIFGEAGYADDVRLECFGLDRNDNEFVIGLMGSRLDWLSKLIQEMRKTTQTSEYIERLGPFFIGKALR